MDQQQNMDRMDPENHLAAAEDEVTDLALGFIGKRCAGLRTDLTEARVEREDILSVLDSLALFLHAVRLLDTTVMTAALLRVFSAEDRAGGDIAELIGALDALEMEQEREYAGEEPQS